MKLRTPIQPVLALLLLVSALNSQFSTTFAQGSLAPPSPPAPTMKSLDQVEPRTPVDAIHTPGNGAAEFVIATPGSYYLTTNIVGVSGENGINIQANNVTLDLNGFPVIGVPGSSSGIAISSANVAVHNGIVSGWGQYGIYSSGMNATLQGLTVCSNSLYGIYAGSNSSVTGNNLVGNNASNTAGYAGLIVTGSDTLIQNNHVVGSGAGTSGDGILILGSGNIVIQNFVEGNAANDFVWGSSEIIGPFISNTSSQIVTNSNPWSNFEF
jgi:hypothetical protein